MSEVIEATDEKISQWLFKIRLAIGNKQQSAAIPRQETAAPAVQPTILEVVK